MFERKQNKNREKYERKQARERERGKEREDARILEWQMGKKHGERKRKDGQNGDNSLNVCSKIRRITHTEFFFFSFSFSSSLFVLSPTSDPFVSRLCFRSI